MSYSSTDYLITHYKSHRAEKSLVAEKYHLVKFKYYAEVQTKKARYPTFKDGAIKSWENLGAEMIEKNIEIHPGQVVIRFKLTAESNILQSIDEQLRKARAKLKKQADEFQKILNKKIGNRNPKSHLFIEYLRILDMKAKDLSDEKIFIILQELPADFETKTSNTKKLDNMARETSRNIKNAIECADKLYQYIALRPNRK